MVLSIKINLTPQSAVTLIPRKMNKTNQFMNDSMKLNSIAKRKK